MSQPERRDIKSLCLQPVKNSNFTLFLAHNEKEIGSHLLMPHVISKYTLSDKSLFLQSNVTKNNVPKLVLIGSCCGCTKAIDLQVEAFVSRDEGFLHCQLLSKVSQLGHLLGFAVIEHWAQFNKIRIDVQRDKIPSQESSSFSPFSGQNVPKCREPEFEITKFLSL